MLPDTITLEVVTPERRVVSETVDAVVLPGIEGSLGVLPGHAPLLTAVGAGELIFTRKGQKQFVAASGGFAEVLADRVIVLAQTAEHAREIDVDRARKKLDEYRTRAQSPTADTDPTMIQAKIAKHLARVSVADKR